MPVRPRLASAPSIARTGRGPSVVLAASLAAACLASACGGPADDATVAEQEAHSDADGGARGAPAPHRFRCDDGSVIPVEFAGLGLELRLAVDGRRLRLTAPATGAAYVGDGASAIFTRDRLLVRREGRDTLTCHRTTRGPTT